MRQIGLTQDQVALVDDCDFERLNEFKWYARKDRSKFYAARMSPLIDGERQEIRMHHEIIGVPPEGHEIDHRNGNGLRNTRENLRFVTRRQNCQNIKNIETSSQYPRVSWHKQDKKWMTSITINGKQKFLGLFTEEFEAFEAYRQAVNANGEEMIEDFRYA